MFKLFNMFKSTGFTNADLTVEEIKKASNKINLLIHALEMQNRHSQFVIAKETTKRFLPKDRTLISKEIYKSETDQSHLENLWYLREKLVTYTIKEEDLLLLNHYLYKNQWRLSF